MTSNFSQLPKDYPIISIDQNCHSLWDTIPKLQAIAAAGRPVRHFVEDIDTAFTMMGAQTETGSLQIAKERFHRSGGADWGAALFYSEFLGRLPVEIREWEPYTGMKTNVLAGKLRKTADELYNEFSPGDNWQLIGPSYIGGRLHHRIIGDLSVAETAEFLRLIMQKARQDMLQKFPEKSSQQRLAGWFSKEESLLAELLASNAEGKLVDIYRRWLSHYLPQQAEINLTSEFFDLRDGGVASLLLEFFLQDYAKAAEFYNTAISDNSVPIHPLDTQKGELPFFATMSLQDHAVRSGVFLDEGNLVVGEKAFRLKEGKFNRDELTAAGISCLAGKAVILATQVRLGRNGAALALPYRGSLYMPAARAFEAKLIAAGIINSNDIKPVVRVRFHLLDRMKGLKTAIRLPEYLERYFGKNPISADNFAQNYSQVAAEARQRLENFKDPQLRESWQKQNFPQLFRKLSELDAHRRELAANNADSQILRSLSKQAKQFQIELLDKTLRQIACDWQMRDVDYWDSRGALMPWSIALGGQEFYNNIIRKAEIYAEPVINNE